MESSNPMTQLLLELLGENVLKEPVIDFLLPVLKKHLPDDRVGKMCQEWFEKYERLKDAYERHEAEALASKEAARAELDALAEEWRGQLAEARALLEQTQAELNELRQVCSEQQALFKAQGGQMAPRALWQSRFAYALTFLPYLPAKATRQELYAVFGGEQLDHLTGAFRPPTEALTLIKKEQYAALPEAERNLIRTLCRQLSRQYDVEPHPAVTALLAKGEAQDD